MKGATTIFHEADESLIAVLGQDYVTSAFQGDFKKSVMILSDKRVYCKGKMYKTNYEGKMESDWGESAIDIHDVTGTTFSENNKPSYLIIGLVLLAGGILSSFLLIPAIIVLVLYFKNRRRLFTVRYHGDALAVDTRWYSRDEMRNFAKSISIAKARKRR